MKKIMARLRREKPMPVVKFGEPFRVVINGFHLDMAVISVQSNYGSPTYGTIATLDHFMEKGDTRG